MRRRERQHHLRLHRVQHLPSVLARPAGQPPKRLHHEHNTIESIQFLKLHRVHRQASGATQRVPPGHKVVEHLHRRSGVPAVQVQLHSAQPELLELLHQSNAAVEQLHRLKGKLQEHHTVLLYRVVRLYNREQILPYKVGHLTGQIVVTHRRERLAPAVQYVPGVQWPALQLQDIRVLPVPVLVGARALLHSDHKSDEWPQ